MSAARFPASMSSSPEVAVPVPQFVQVFGLVPRFDLWLGSPVRSLANWGTQKKFETRCGHGAQQEPARPGSAGVAMRSASEYGGSTGRSAAELFMERFDNWWGRRKGDANNDASSGWLQRAFESPISDVISA